jgi:hypothetical protein
MNKLICSGYDGMMNTLSYYKGDVLCWGQDSEGCWFIIGTEKP